MSEITSGVNWLAVIAGAILAYLLGWLWYSPKLFGSKWAQGVGITLDSDAAPAPAAMIAQAIGTFLLAWVVGITAAANALTTVILIALTIVALMAAGGLFCRKSGYAIATETGFVAAMVVVMIVCQAVF